MGGKLRRTTMKRANFFHYYQTFRNENKLISKVKMQYKQ